MEQTSLISLLAPEDTGSFKAESQEDHFIRSVQCVETAFNGHNERTLAHLTEAMRDANKQAHGYPKLTKADLIAAVEHLACVGFLDVKDQTYRRRQVTPKHEWSGLADRDRVGSLDRKHKPVPASHVIKGYPTYPHPSPKGKYAGIYAIYNRKTDALHIEVTAIGFGFDKGEAYGKIITDGTYYPAVSAVIREANPDAYNEGRRAVVDADEGDLYFVPLVLGLRIPARFNATYSPHGLEFSAHLMWRETEKARLMPEVWRLRTTPEREAIKAWVRAHLPRVSAVARRKALERLVRRLATTRQPSPLAACQTSLKAS